jgi:lactose/L-arabinose transport system permease protein
VRVKRFFSDLVLHVVVFIGFIISVYPIYWMFVASTQDNEHIFGPSIVLGIGKSLAKNYHDLMTNSGINIYQAIGNSLIVSVTSTVLSVIIAVMAGYAFAMYKFRLSKPLFALILAAVMIPPQVTLIPLFIIMSHANLINTLIAVILPSLVSVFGLFLMRQSFLSFPMELLDAGRIDGMSESYIFWRVVLPIMRPTLSSLGIITFLGSWTNLLWPLVVLNDSSLYTIPVALSTLTSTQTQPNYGMIMLGASIATLPMLILFLVLRRNFVSGLTSGVYR